MYTNITIITTTKGLETRLTTPKPENYSFKKKLINMITGEKTMFEVTSDNKLILLMIKQ